MKSVALLGKDDVIYRLDQNATVSELTPSEKSLDALRGKVPRVDPLATLNYLAVKELLTSAFDPSTIDNDLRSNIALRVWSSRGNHQARLDFLDRFERGYISASHYAASNPNALCSVPAIGLGLTGGHSVLHGTLTPTDALGIAAAISPARFSIVAFCDHLDDGSYSAIAFLCDQSIRDASYSARPSQRHAPSPFDHLGDVAEMHLMSEASGHIA